MTTKEDNMIPDIWYYEDIRRALQTANAARTDVQGLLTRDGCNPSLAQDDLAAFQTGYEAALMAVASALGVRLQGNAAGPRTPDIVVPRPLAVSYRAEKALEHLLETREEWCQ